jgi:hypothetical protein
MALWIDWGNLLWGYCYVICILINRLAWLISPPEVSNIDAESLVAGLKIPFCGESEDLINLVYYSPALWHHITVCCKYFGISDSSLPWIPQNLTRQIWSSFSRERCFPWLLITLLCISLLYISVTFFEKGRCWNVSRWRKKIRQPLMFKKTILIVSETLRLWSCCVSLPCFPPQRGWGENWLDIIWWKAHDYCTAALEGGVKMKRGFSKAMILLIICPVSLRFELP